MTMDVRVVRSGTKADAMCARSTLPMPNPLHASATGIMVTQCEYFVVACAALPFPWRAE